MAPFGTLPQATAARLVANHPALINQLEIIDMLYAALTGIVRLEY